MDFERPMQWQIVKLLKQRIRFTQPVGQVDQSNLCVELCVTFSILIIIIGAFIVLELNRYDVDMGIFKDQRINAHLFSKIKSFSSI